MIVVAVLLAFQADHWAERRSERSREQGRLVELKTDFEENAQRLDSIIGLQQQTVAAVSAALAWADGTVDGVDTDSLRVLAVWANSFQRFTPVLGGYEASLASGDLSLLRNQELKLRLASFSRAATVGNQDAPGADLLHTELTKRGAQLVRWWRVLPPESLQFLGYDGPPSQEDPAALFGDDEYMGLLMMTGFAEAWHLSFFQQLREDAHRILELIDAALAYGAPVDMPAAAEDSLDG